MARHGKATRLRGPVRKRGKIMVRKVLRSPRSGIRPAAVRSYGPTIFCKWPAPGGVARLESAPGD